MALGYLPITWDRQKKTYDKTMAALIVATMGLFISATLLTHPGSTIETLIIRASAVTALLILHVILCIGPLARLDRRFLPLLYNRRHLGVTMFFLALVHAVFAIIQFHALGDLNPLVSALTSYHEDINPFRPAVRFTDFPFEPLGFLALMILFLMAATSHDFWLKHLGASVWKSLHLGVYLAYGLIVGHVCLGALQSERHPLLAILLAIGLVIVLSLHVAAAIRESRLDARRSTLEADGFVATCRTDELEESQGKVVVADGKRLALFRQDGKIFGLSNVCRHQGGPIGEGRMVDGCVTCPWHGWQYKAEDGCSPPPFKEVIPTHRVRIEDGTIYINPTANALGTDCPGIACEVN